MAFSTLKQYLARDYNDVTWNQFFCPLCQDGIFYLAIILLFRYGMLYLDKALLHRDDMLYLDYINMHFYLYRDGIFNLHKAFTIP